MSDPKSPRVDVDVEAWARSLEATNNYYAAYAFRALARERDAALALLLDVWSGDPDDEPEMPTLTERIRALLTRAGLIDEHGNPKEKT